MELFKFVSLGFFVLLQPENKIRLEAISTVHWRIRATPPRHLRLTRSFAAWHPILCCKQIHSEHAQCQPN